MLETFWKLYILWKDWIVAPTTFFLKLQGFGDFAGGPVVKNLPPNAGNVGTILGWGNKIP